MYMLEEKGLVLEGGGFRGMYTSGVIDVFMENHINLSYIASRPSKHKFGEYIFIVNFDGHIHNPKTMLAIQQVKEQTTHLRFLGSYKKQNAIALQQ